MAVNYGSRRTVVGAHYGTRDWLAQLIFFRGEIGYDKWAGIFASQPMKMLTFATIVALLYHVWVGMRDVLMDYVKPVGIRLVLQILVLVWLLGCVGWVVQVLWRV